MNNKNITFKKIESVNDPYFTDICTLLEDSFISDERRDYNAALLAKKKFNLCAIFYSGVFMGMKSWWNFEKFIYTEHIAVAKEFQNKGIGGTLFKMFFQAYPCELYILETERGVTEIACRRMGFYERLGYKINLKFDYIQPPYSKEKSPVPMYLVSYPVKLTQHEYQKIMATVHSEVYDFKQKTNTIDIAQLKPTTTETQLWLLELIKIQDFAQDIFSQELFSQIVPYDNNEMKISENFKIDKLHSELTKFKYKNELDKNNSTVKMISGFYCKKDLKEDSQLIILGIFYNEKNKNPVGYIVQTIFLNKPNEIYTKLDFFKRDPIAHEALGISDYTMKFMRTALSELNVKKQKIDCGWLGRQVWAQKGYSFDETVLISYNNKPVSQCFVAQQNFQNFIQKNNLDLCNLRIKEKNQTLKKINSIDELTKPIDFVNIIHYQDKKISISPNIDHEIFGDEKELDVGKAFVLGRYYPQHGDLKADSKKQLNRITHPDYPQLTLTDDAMIIWTTSCEL